MAVHRALGGRDPLSYPRLESDDQFQGKLEIEKFPFSTTTSQAQREEPYQRLYNTHTLTSSRHQVFNHDHQAPNDSLDFLLKAKYDQHADLLSPLNKSRYQKETFDEDHGRILKNREKVVVVAEPPLNHPLKVASDDRKNRLEQAKLAISRIFLFVIITLLMVHEFNGAISFVGSNHTILTGRGYDRKPCGGLFTA